MPKLPPKNGKRVERINTLLIDGNALFKRGYLGSHDAYNKSGEHVGGIYQFITVLKKLLTEDMFHRVYVFWDGNFSGKLRWEIYKDYKSNRNKDFELGTEPDDEMEKLQQYIVKEYLYHLSIKQIEDEVVEADDYIALYCNTKAENEDITICTSDRDICQLVNDKIKVYLCDKKTYLTKANYNEHFNHDLSNLVLVKIMGGDSADMIKGIRGIKEPTLLKYFPMIRDRHVTVDELLEESKRILSERTEQKKPPIKALENIVNSVTDGIQGEDIYRINKSLIDLSEPKLTEDALEHFNAVVFSDIEVRNIKTVYELMKRDGLDDLISDYYMADYLLPFKKLTDRNKKLIN